MGKKLIQSNDKLPITLTAAERKLILEDLICLDDECEQIIRNTPDNQPVMLTLDELDDLGGHVAAEANHCEVTKKQKQLDRVFEKIQGLLDEFTDEAQPTIKIARAPQSTPKRKATQVVAGDTLYQFKITLLGIEPPIWRRIQVQDCTLDKLHEHFQTAMGWTNSHLHMFEIKGQSYGDPDLLEDEFEFTDSTTTMLSDVLPRKRFAFKYDYDFGDSWEHEVLFEGCPPAEKVKYPVCLEGERACPPEDVGGIWGYQEFLTAIADPKHEQHRELRRWGGKFSPEHFDAVKASKAMKMGLPDWRKMRESERG